ncbi:hypothetical protein BDZ89DRAFT_313860 [Hymenopellis radicata]|nr:hypothetical protein BDZ89DRAFT_313860 [Hymenopellis radicata]
MTFFASTASSRSLCEQSIQTTYRRSYGYTRQTSTLHRRSQLRGNVDPRASSGGHGRYSGGFPTAESRRCH